MAAPETPEAYEARLVDFLLHSPRRRRHFGDISVQCRWSGAEGTRAYSRFVRERPHLFSVVDVHYVQLVSGAAAAAPALAAPQQPAPAPQKPSIIAGALQPAAAYQAALVAYLSRNGRSLVSTVGEAVPRQVGVGRPLHFMQSRPHVFIIEAQQGGHIASLKPGIKTAGITAALPPSGQGRQQSAAEQAYEAAIVAYLARCGQTQLGSVGNDVPRPVGVAGTLLRFTQRRPHVFVIEETQGGHFASLKPGVAAGAPPPPPPLPRGQQNHQQQQAPFGGCGLCNVARHTSASARRDHEAGRPHLLRVVKSLQTRKHGVLLTGPAQLGSAPGAFGTAALMLRNDGPASCTLLRAPALLSRRADVTLLTTPPEGTVLPPGAALPLQLRHAPTQACVARVMVVCSLRAFDGTCFSVGHEMLLRAARADADTADEALLRPTSAYVRPPRRPPRAAQPDVFTAAMCRFETTGGDALERALAALDGGTLEAALPDTAQGAPLLTSMSAAWLAAPACFSSLETIDATVVMEGVPPAEDFTAAHQSALAAALQAVLSPWVVRLAVLSVTSHAARVVPGVPLSGAVSQRVRLENIAIPKALRAALDAPAGDPRREALEAELAPPLSAANHAARFATLLLCEEIQQQTDIRMYDIPAAQLDAQAGSRALWLRVPGLAEARPSVMRGDKVVVAGDAASARQYEGVVHAVHEERVALRFAPDFHARHVTGLRFRARFVLRRTPMLLQHAALKPPPGQLACCPPELLFPLPPADSAAAFAAAAAVDAVQLPHPPLFNRQLNARQLQAVRGALCTAKPAANAPYIIFGPPGTGKTCTVVEFVLQVLARARAPGSGIRPNMPAAGSAPAEPTGIIAGMLSRLRLSGAPSRPPPELLVLVAAPSNAAVDVVASRLLRGGLPASQLLRANAYQRPKNDVAPELLPSSTWSEADEAFLLPTERSSYDGKWVVAATCATAQKLARVPGCAGLFSHVVIDEAGQAAEPECMCAVAGLLRPGGARLVLAGDPKQLGPVLRSALAARCGLGTSFLERLTDATPGGPHARTPISDDPALVDGFHPAYTTLLTDNYRSHPALIAVSSTAFYNNALVACADAEQSHAFCNWEGLTEAARNVPGGFPLLFHGVEGEDAREGNSPSWFNALEATAVLGHVRSAIAHRGGGVGPKDVGVVTPYHKQALKVRALLDKHGLRDVAVGSVEKFQGGERSVIVLSAVRSSPEHVAFDAKHALGFLSNPKRFNVAITRARSLLIVVGNPAVLARDAHWAALLRHAVRHGAYAGCALPAGFDGDADNQGGDEAQETLRRVAEEEAARAQAEARARGEEGEDVRTAEEGPAWNDEA